MFEALIFPNFTLQVKKKTRVIGEISAAETLQCWVKEKWRKRAILNQGFGKVSSDIFGKKGCKFFLLNGKEFCQLHDILKEKGKAT